MNDSNPPPTEDFILVPCAFRFGDKLIVTHQEDRKVEGIFIAPSNSSCWINPDKKEWVIVGIIPTNEDLRKEPMVNVLIGEKLESVPLSAISKSTTSLLCEFDEIKPGEVVTIAYRLRHHPIECTFYAGKLSTPGNRLLGYLFVAFDAGSYKLITKEDLKQYFFYKEVDQKAVDLTSSHTASVLACIARGEIEQYLERKICEELIGKENIHYTFREKSLVRFLNTVAPVFGEEQLKRLSSTIQNIVNKYDLKSKANKDEISFATYTLELSSKSQRPHVLIHDLDNNSYRIDLLFFKDYEQYKFSVL